MRYSLSLLVLVGFVLLSSVDNAFAHVTSGDFVHQKIHEITKLLENYTKYYEDLENNFQFSEFAKEDLLDIQTITEKLIEFYKTNEMISDFGNGHLTPIFASTGTVDIYSLPVVVHTEATKYKTILVNTNYELIKSAFEVYTSVDHDYLSFVNEFSNEKEILTTFKNR